MHQSVRTVALIQGVGAPSLLMDYSGGTVTLPAGFTFTRGSTGWLTDINGDLAAALTNVPRMTYVDGVASGILLEDARIGALRNSEKAGASAGVAPTNWSIPGGDGLTATVLQKVLVDGIQCLDVQVQGTASGTSGLKWSLDASTIIAALPSQKWAYTFSLAHIAGTQKLIQVRAQQRSASANIVETVSQFVGNLTSDLSRYEYDWTLTSDVTTAFLRPFIGLSGWAVSEVVDFTVRIGELQLELTA